MEIILQKIIIECGNKSKFSVVKKTVVEALESFTRNEDAIGSKLEVYELREKCLAAIELVLDSKCSRLVGLGTNALQTFLIDRKLRSSDYDQETNEQKLPLQLVHTLHDLPFWSNDSNLQCHCFTILLQLTSTEDLNIDFGVIRSVIELCISTFTGAINQTSTEMAARATVIQSLNSFCTSRDNGSEKSSNDTAHILSFFCEKLKSITSTSQQSAALLLMLDGVQAVLAAQDVFVSDFLADMLWQEFIPILVNILGDPNHISLSNQSSSPNMSPSIENAKGRGITHTSSNLVISQSCDIAKALYKICEEILRLLGRRASMRSVLEALFHRMLLFPSPEKRLDALKALKNILHNHKVVLSLAFFNTDSGNFDMNLWKIFIDSLAECSVLEPSNNIDLIWESTRCLSSFINSLVNFCGENEKDLPTENTIDLDLTLCHAINGCFPKLENIKNEDFSVELRKFNNIKAESLIHEDIVIDHAYNEIGQNLTSLADQLNSKLTDDRVEDGVIQYLNRIRQAWEANVTSYDDRKWNKNNHSLKKMTSFDDREFESANRYLELLASRMSEWNSAKSTIELDALLQSFASETVEDFMLQQLQLLKVRGSTYEIAIYNVDALYLLTYATLLLYVQILGSEDGGPKCTISEDEYISRVIDIGVIVYISTPFLRAVYSLVLNKNDILFKDDNVTSNTIFNLIEGLNLSLILPDYSGQKGHLLSDFLRLDQSAYRKSESDRLAAARRIVRSLVVTSWADIIKILSKPFECKHYYTEAMHGSPKNRDYRLELSPGIVDGLAGLQKLLILCPNLGLSCKTNEIFRLLVEMSCSLEDLKASKLFEQNSKPNDSKLHAISSKLALNFNLIKNSLILHPAHALSMQLLLDNALQAGSLDNNCWHPFLRCIEYIAEFEAIFFRTDQKTAYANDRNISSFDRKTESNNNLNDDIAFVLPSSPVRFSEDVIETIDNMINDAQSEVSRKFNCDLLYAQMTARLLSILSSKIERFYDECSRCLNLQALRELCKALVSASQTRLFYGSVQNQLEFASNSLTRYSFIEQISRIMIRVAKSGRPLVHVITLWGVVAPHFVEAACVNSPAVSHRSVELLRDCSTALLDNVSGFDLKNFHFNETLLQPFQTILCLELCDEQCVDAILCTIGELVESYKQEIFTGWRSLFGALRAARNHFLLYKSNLSVDNVQHFHNAFVDVFSTFLKSDNAKTFCRASNECMSCLLRFLADDEGSLTLLDNGPEGDCTSPNVSENADVERKTLGTPNFAHTALCFLRQCHSLLVSTYEICNDDLLVHLMHRLTEKNHTAECVDHEIPSASRIDMPSLASILAENQSALFGWNFSPHFLDFRVEDKPIEVPWENLPVGKRLICEIWVDLIDGLISSIIYSSADIQPEVIECVYDILEMMLSVPGIEFGAYCMNHILLPTLQRWLRRETADMQDHDFRENKNGVRNFKHCVGLLMEIVCTYIKSDSGAPCTRFLLLQTLDLLIECASTSSEFIARLSCSSLRHLIETSKQNFTVELWSCVCRSIWRFGDVTLRPLRSLMSCFEKNSTRYDGNSGRSVQVAIRKDTNPTEAARLRVLAQQVFFAECQKYEQNLEENPDQLSQSYRSVVFLLNSIDESDNASTIRLTFRNIVVGLLTHQLFLQLLGSILCDGTDFKVPSRCTALTKNLTANASQDGIGCLRFLNDEQICSLLSCLDASFTIAVEFDCRPGLKFLIQKVFSSPVCANLYKNLVTCWTYQISTFYTLSKDIFIAKSQPLWRVPPSEKCLQSYPDLDNVAIDFDGLVKNDIPRSLWYARALSLRYARVCSLIRRLEHRKDDIPHYSIDNSSPILEFLRADMQNEDSPIVVRSPRDQTDSSSSTSFEADIEKLEKSTNEIGGKSQEQVYTLASNDYIENCLKDFKRNKKKQQNVLPSGKDATAAVEGSMDCSLDPKRINPFHGDQSNFRTDSDRAKDFEAYENSSLKNEATTAFLDDKQISESAWSEMVTSLPAMIMTIDNNVAFKNMIPLFFGPLTRAATVSTSTPIKLLLVDLLYKLSDVFHFLDNDGDNV